MFSIFCGLFLLLFVFTKSAGAQERYMIGYAGFAGFQVSMWAVKDLGLLKKYGLDGEVVMVPGTIRQIQALVSDSIHFAHLDAAGSVRGIMGGADFVMVGASLNRFPFSFVTQKEIRKPADLVGKKIGIVGFGGANDFAVTVLLNEWKIPRGSVTVLQAGGGATRLVAMATKALDATVLSYPELGEAIRMGMHVMSDLTELTSAEYPMSVVGVRRSFLQRNRDAVKRFLMAYTEGTHQFMTDREKGISVYRKRLKQDNPKVLEDTYNFFASRFSFPPRVSQEGLRSTLALIAKGDPKVETNLNRYVDESILDELEKEGFFKRIAGQ